MIADCSEFLSQSFQMYGCVFHYSNGQNLGQTLDPVVPLARILHGHPLAGLLWERQLEEVLIKLGWESRMWLPCGRN